MARNSELDSLKTREQEAFRRKQLAYQKYADAKDRASAAYNIMQSAWEERCSAREEMNREYESMQHSSDNYREVWGEYSRIRDANNSRIESLRYEADSEHQMMKDCFEQASAAYEYGDKSEAPGYAAQGHEHKDRRNELNEEVGRLIQEIRNAKEAAECRAPKTDSSAFRRAKEVFSSAKSCHESAEAEFKRLKAERDRAKAEFNSAQEEFIRLRDEFQKKLAEVKAENQRERDKTLDEAGINWSERDDAKIVKKADGTVQIYHGGLGSGDGLGHGHTAIDQFGHKTYDRGAFEEHGHQNYTDDSGKGVKTYDRSTFEEHGRQNCTGGCNKGFTMYDRRARTDTEIGGSGKENYINVRTGVGHTTQWYKDGYRVSWDTNDGGQTEKAHWTNQNLPYGHPDRHKCPDDANV